MYLEHISEPADLRELSYEQLDDVADQGAVPIRGGTDRENTPKGG